MKRNARFMLGAATAAIIAISAAGCAAGQAGSKGNGASAYPSGAIEFVTAGSPGGGLDIFARQIQRSLDKEGLLDVQLDITNLGGGGGNAAMALGRNRAGTADTLIGNSNRVYLAPLMGTTDLKVNQDFVPIAQLMTEYVVLAVRTDSPYSKGTDVIDALVKNPRALKFGVGTVPSDDQTHLLRVAAAGGADASRINIVAFDAGGDLMTQLLGGQVDAISTGLSEALPMAEAGKVKIIAISSPERLKGTAGDIPTWKEQGLDVVVEHWRGVFGPADMPKEAVTYWEETFAKMVKTDTWAKVLEQNQWSPLYRDSAEFSKVTEEEAKVAEGLLRSVGLID